MNMKLDEETLGLVTRYALENGANWKNDLAADWHQQRLSGALQKLEKSHGLRWLATFDLLDTSSGRSIQII
jgi:hypothetical protein